MKTIYTQVEAKSMLDFAQEEFDIVRLVTPTTQHVCEIGSAIETRELCTNFWNRRERCENCTSNRALQTRGKALKLEVLHGKTYLIVSKYLEIDGMPRVLEMISDVSENMTLDSDQKNELAHIIRNYNRLLITDPLTHAYNRRFLDDHFIPSLNCCHDPHTAIHLAVMDIDSFKHINDTYGHAAGDLVLKDVTSFWRLHFDSRQAHRERLVIRLGGDEILIIACGMPFEEFHTTVLRCYKEMRKICYFKENICFSFNISIGFSSSEAYHGKWTWSQLFEAADHNMYECKQLRKRQ